MDSSDSTRKRQTVLTGDDQRSPAQSSGRPFLAPNRNPVFPEFKSLEITDQFEIEQWVKQYPPYSDFNFVSMWCWNTVDEFQISWLNGNLVVIFNDYHSGERFLSFIGTNAVFDTATRLLDYARDHNLAEELRLLPETTVRALESRDGLRLTRSPHHRDYVLSTINWSEMYGSPFRKKRNEISAYERRFHPECRQIDLSDPEIQRQLNDVFGRWASDSGKQTFAATVTESLALLRVFTLLRPQDLLAYGVYVQGEMVGYSINERLSNGYAMGHHQKVAGRQKSAYALMLRTLCEQLSREGIDYLNIQQDLGEPGLEKAKKLHRPVRYLHKFQIARAHDVRDVIDETSAVEREVVTWDHFPVPAVSDGIGAGFAHV